MISDHIKPEHRAGWEHVAGKLGRTVEEHAQARFDELGDGMERERVSDDETAQRALFGLALKLPLGKRDELRAKLLEMAAAEGLAVPQG